MKPFLLLLIFAIAKPGYRYEFPRDHFAHREFRTEWWYWTGNLFDAGGRRFGFELTFFREAVSEDRERHGVWDAPDAYLAHLTLTDVAGRKFYHEERLHRAGPGLAGADLAQGRIWNGNWEATLATLKAIAPGFSFDLRTHSNKPPVIHGVDGISRKAAGPGRASHYISFTRLDTEGVIRLGGQSFSVKGLAWMDHEFFTNQLDPEQTGWDWMSVQLGNGEDLMLTRLRRKDGSIDPFSSGTFVDAAGRARHLAASEIAMEPGKTWTSPDTGARYPIEWRIRIPSLALELEATTPLATQELVSRTTYWEGAMDYAGTRENRPIRGVGYLEMTGYAGAVRLY